MCVSSASLLLTTTTILDILRFKAAFLVCNALIASFAVWNLGLEIGESPGVWWILLLICPVMPLG